MLTDYKYLTTSILVDLLARETLNLTQLLSHKKFDHEYEKSKDILKRIQKVIRSRDESTLSIPSHTTFIGTNPNL